MTNEEIVAAAISNMVMAPGDSVNLAQLESFGNLVLRIRAEEEFKPKTKYDYYLAKYSQITNTAALGCKIVKVVKGTNPELIWQQADSLVEKNIIYDLVPFKIHREGRE